MTIKEIRDIETEELQGYQVDFGDGIKWSVAINGNRYHEIEVAMRGWYDEEVPVMEEYTETTYTYDDDGNATEITTVKERQAMREITETVKDPEGNEVTVVVRTEPLWETRRIEFEPIIPEPAYTAEERKEYLVNKKVAELKQARTDEINAPFNGVQVATPEDRENIQGVVQAFDMLYPSGKAMWTMADNTEQELTKADLEAVVNGYITRKAQAFAKYQALKDAALKATTKEELEAVKW